MTHPAPAVTTRRGPEVLPSGNLRALSVQAVLLVSSAFLVPALAHAAGLPVRLLLPMHWPVMLVGLCYGWRSGALVGLGAPTLSYLISGYPLPAILPSMTVELGAYGLVAGLACHALGLGRPASTLLAGVAGRLVFVGMVLLTGAAGGPLGAYLTAALVPGLPALLGQVVLLAPLAAWWVRREQIR